MSYYKHHDIGSALLDVAVVLGSRTAYRVGSRTTVPFLVLYVHMGSRTIAWDLIPRWISYNTVSRTAWDRIAWDLVLATAWDLVLCGISYSVGSCTARDQNMSHYKYVTMRNYNMSL